MGLRRLAVSAAPDHMRHVSKRPAGMRRRRRLEPKSSAIGATVAMAGRSAPVSGGPGLAFLGAMALLTADLRIGVNRFIAPWVGSTLLIVAVYSTGQGMLLAAMLRHQPRRAGAGPA